MFHFGTLFKPITDELVSLDRNSINCFVAEGLLNIRSSARRITKDSSSIKWLACKIASPIHFVIFALYM